MRKLFFEDMLGDGVSWVNFDQPFVTHEGESGDTKEGVENVNFVSRAVSDASVVGVLAVEDEGFKLFVIDPVLTVDHVEGT